MIAHATSSRSGFRSRSDGRSPYVAFTLIELVAVMVLVSILSLTVTPLLATMRSSRDSALAREVERRLQLARAHGMTTGRPTGLTLDVAEQALRLVYIAEAGAAPAPLPGASGEAEGHAQESIEAMFPGSALLAIDVGGAGAFDTIWFDYQGVPHLRSETGAFVQNLTEDAHISLAGEHVVTVRHTTGMVER